MFTVDDKSDLFAFLRLLEKIGIKVAFELSPEDDAEVVRLEQAGTSKSLVSRQVVDMPPSKTKIY